MTKLTSFFTFKQFLIYSLVVSIICLSFISDSVAQCPTEIDISFVSGGQDSLNNYALNHPTCSNLENLIINGPYWPGVTSLLPLANIDSVFGNVILIDVGLENFDGLQALKYIGGDLQIINNNDDLVSTFGLDALNFVGGDLIFRNNDLVDTLEYFSNLQNIGGSLIVDDNTGMDQMLAFGMLQSIGSDFIIANNVSLKNISDFSNLKTVGGKLEIIGNNQVNAINNFSVLESIGDTLQVTDNLVLPISNAFQNVQSIGGALILQTIDTQFGFDNLQSVSAVEIRNCPLLTTLNSFDQLTSVTGDLNVLENENLISLAGFNALASVGGNLSIRDNEISSLEGFANLINIDSSFYLYEPIMGFQAFEKLTTIGGTFKIRHATIPPDLVALKTIGGDLEFMWTSFQSLNHFNDLISIGGSLKIFTPALDTLMGFEKLESANDFPFGGFKDIQFWGGFNNLQQYHGDFVIANHKFLDSLAAFSSLHTIDGDFILQSNNSLRDISNFTSLSQVNGFFHIADSYGLLNISGFDILKDIIVFTSDASPPAFSIRNNFSLNKISSFNGMEELEGEIQIDLNPNLDSIVGFNALKKVSFYQHPTTSSQFSTFKHLNGFNSVDTIGKLWFIHGPDVQTIQGFENLKHVEEGLQYYNCSNLIQLPAFNKLVTLDKFTLALCPKLKSYDGLNALDHVAILSFGSCDSLETVSGFASLDSIGSLAMGTLPSLVAFPKFDAVTEVGSFYFTVLNALENMDQMMPNVQHITTLAIQRNEQLNTITGFDNLKSLSRLFIQENDKVLTLPTFPKLENSMDEIRLTENTILESFTGFEKLNSLNELLISRNDSLKMIEGFGSLQLMNENFILEYNPVLADINGFYNLAEIKGQVEMLANVSLGPCNFNFLCHHLSNGGFVALWNNGPACSTQDSILYECSLISPLKIFTFYDINNNKVFDVDEASIGNIIYDLSPNNSQIYSSLTGPTNLYLPDNVYQINFSPGNDLWTLTTDSTGYTVQVVDGESSDSLYFGLSPTQDIADMASIVNSTEARCNNFVSFDVHATNLGTSFTSGTLWFEIDTLISLYEFVQIPDFQDGQNKFGWTFDNLHPTGSFSKQIDLFIPGPDVLDPGTILSHNSYVEFNANGNDFFSQKIDYTTLVLCSFDPNDKLVYPRRAGHYTLPDEELIYTIRFQNTGNAAAIDVLLIDTLDVNLDPTTFNLLSSSHADVLTTDVRENNIIHFSFNDIYLPDSLTNEAASHGYVSFSIAPIAGLEIFDEINNSAAIYFDQNPPIITNETLNIIALDEDSDGAFSPIDCDDQNENISPFLSEIPGNGIDDDCNPDTVDDDLDGDGYVSAEDCDDENELINPGATEIPYNGIDEDCNALTLDDDLDGDGYLLADDCDDENELINPGALEVPYNGIDEDCNASTLDDDLDGDGYLLADDCDDENELINPDATEVPYNGIDEDCNVLTLDDDLDGDGYLLADDCDDMNSAINPGAVEIIDNEIDEDCDGGILTDIVELSKFEISVQPNPANRYIDVFTNYAETTQLRIYSINGQLIYKQEDLSRIDIRSFHEGVYYLQILSDQSRSIFGQKIIIQK